MEQMSYIMLFTDYADTVDELSDEDAGRLLKALLHYGLGEEEQKPAGEARLVYSMLKKQIDRQREKSAGLSATRANAGGKGGRPRKKAETAPETESGELPGQMSLMDLAEEAGEAGNLILFPVRDEKAKKAIAFSEKQEKHLLSEKSKTEYIEEKEEDKEDREMDDDHSTAGTSITGAREELTAAPRRQTSRLMISMEAAIRTGGWRKLYGEGFGLLEELIHRDVYPLDLVEAAIFRTDTRAKRGNLNSPISYTISLLKDWIQRGIRTAGDLEKADALWREYGVTDLDCELARETG